MMRVLPGGLADPASNDNRRSVPERLARKLSEGVAGFRAFLMQRINDVNATTAREVLAAAASMGAVVERASQQIHHMKALAATLDGSGSGGGVAAAVAKQSQVLRVFFESMTRDISRQEQTAERATQHLQRITKAASDTAHLASAARLLALNARIEAARVGGSGNCFSTIAGEMQHLAEQITKANEFIDGVASRLSQDLPEVAASARALRASSEELRNDLRLASSELEEETVKMRGVLRSMLDKSDSELAFLVNTSNEALSHLQFQDVVAQGLLRIEPALHDLQVAQAKLLEIPDVIAHLPRPQHNEIGGDKPVDQENAGEVMLF